MALNWSFKARLHNTSDLMKNRYCQICNELASYEKVSTSESWDRVRIYVGRKTYGYLSFKGKTLCVALALVPSEYEGTKYVFDDLSEMTKFASTPFFTRMTSDRQVRYLKELLDTMFDNLEKDAVSSKTMDIPFFTQEELIEMNLIKITGKTKTVKSKTPEEKVEQLPSKPIAADQPKPVEDPKPVVEEPKPIVEKPKPIVEKPAERKESAPLPVVRPKTVAPAKGHIATGTKLRKTVVNLGTLQKMFDNGATISLQELIEKGLVAKNTNCLKVLAGGILNKQLTVIANKFSGAALTAIEQAGGTAKIADVK